MQAAVNREWASQPEGTRLLVLGSHWVGTTKSWCGPGDVTFNKLVKGEGIVLRKRLGSRPANADATSPARSTMRVDHVLLPAHVGGNHWVRSAEMAHCFGRPALGNLPPLPRASSTYSPSC